MSFHLARDGVFQEEGISKLLTDAGTRNLSDNLSDLKAQVAANQQGLRCACANTVCSVAVLTWERHQGTSTRETLARSRVVVYKWAES